MLALMLPVYVPAIPASGLLSPGRRSNLLRIVSKGVSILKSKRYHELQLARPPPAPPIQQ